MGRDPRTIFGAIEQVAAQTGRVADALSFASGGDLVGTAEGPYEVALARWSRGTGTFYEEDGVGYIVVNGTQYTFGGEEDGTYEAVFQAWFTNPAQVLKWPPPAEPPYDEPSPVPQITDVNQTKARWTFGDGSSLSGPGPAVSYLTPLKDGSFQFWVSAAAAITGGTGRFANAIGQECSLGSTWFPGVPELKPGTSFAAKVTHTFRVILGEDRGELPPPEAEEEAEEQASGKGSEKKSSSKKGSSKSKSKGKK